MVFILLARKGTLIKAAAATKTTTIVTTTITTAYQTAIRLLLPPELFPILSLLLHSYFPHLHLLRLRRRHRLPGWVEVLKLIHGLV